MFLLCERHFLSGCLTATTVAWDIKTLQNNLILNIGRPEKTGIQRFVALDLPYDLIRRAESLIQFWIQNPWGVLTFIPNLNPFPAP